MGGAYVGQISQGNLPDEKTSGDKQARLENESIEEQIVRYVNDLDEISTDECLAMKQLLLKHKSLFSEEPGCTHMYNHVITPIIEKPHVRKSYPVPLYQQAAVELEIEKMLQLGIIERLCSEFCNPIRVVSKKNGEVRICLDPRFLNKVIASDNESPPRSEELLQKHEGAVYFSTTDLVKGYW